MTKLQDTLCRFNACVEAREWAGGRALCRAWHDCERGDWLLWLAARVGVDRRYVVAAACACAQGSLHLVPAGEERPRDAVKTAIRWTRGLATIEEVRAAAHAAYAAAYAAHAAYAAAHAAYAANAAAYAAAANAAAANAAANAAATGLRRTFALHQCAERVRATIPWPMVRDAWREAAKGGWR